MEDEVVLLDFWPSMFCARARIALAMKGIQYEPKEEDLLGNMKSQILLESNPALKTVPVLIHNGKPVCESLIIVEYIDQVWSHKSPLLLPDDPYQRAHAKFWADFIDKKIWSNGRKIWRLNGENMEETKVELIESLKLLEENLGEKRFFGGENLGFLDVAFIPYHSWFYVYETFGKFEIEEHCPKLTKWAKRCLTRESVSSSLPDQLKIYDFVLHVNNFFKKV